MNLERIKTAAIVTALSALSGASLGLFLFGLDVHAVAKMIFVFTAPLFGAIPLYFTGSYVWWVNLLVVVSWLSDILVMGEWGSRKEKP